MTLNDILKNYRIFLCTVCTDRVAIAFKNIISSTIIHYRTFLFHLIGVAFVLLQPITAESKEEQYCI